VKIKGFNVFAVVLAFLLTLTGGMMLDRVLAIYTMEKPFRQALEELETVESFEMQKKDGKFDLLIQLGNVNDLPHVYKEIYVLARNMLGKKVGIIVIRDNRDEILTELYHKVHYALYEAVENGNFSVMAEKIDEVLKPYDGITYKLFVDNDIIYFHMKHENKYLYEIIPRSVRNGMDDTDIRGENWW
jgi:hypothetical protein